MRELTKGATLSVCGLMSVAISYIEEGNYSEAMRVLQETIVDLGGTFEFGVREE